MFVSDRGELVARVTCFTRGIITSDARSRAFLQVRASYLRLSLSDDRALWCKCNPDTDMGISRVASEIQIYSAVYSPVVDRDVCVRRVRSRARARARTRSRSHGWLCILQDAGLRANSLAHSSRGNHICSVTKLRILHTGPTVAVTYLTFGQVARVELKCAPRKVFGIFGVASSARRYVCKVAGGSGSNSTA